MPCPQGEITVPGTRFLDTYVQFREDLRLCVCRVRPSVSCDYGPDRDSDNTPAPRVCGVRRSVVSCIRVRDISVESIIG